MDTKRSPAALAGLVALGVVALQALLVAWFAWPAQRTAPHDLPVVVAGPAPATGALADRLRAGHPGAFTITTVPDAAAADAALRGRRAYAAFVLAPTGPSVHVASAASPAVATLVGQAAQQLGGGRQVPVVDVVAAPAGDPRGAGFLASYLALLLTCMVGGIALLFAVRSHLARLVGVVGFAALAGVAAAGVLSGLGVVAGSYAALAGAVGLLALAVSATVSGLGALLGRAGVGLGALVVFFFGNPISGLTSAPELLPQPWGAIGRLLPPGAGIGLLRSVAFFDGAGAAGPLWVLAAWAAGGLALTAVGHARRAAAGGTGRGGAGRARRGGAGSGTGPEHRLEASRAA
jgi:hypothetical protein